MSEDRFAEILIELQSRGDKTKLMPALRQLTWTGWHFSGFLGQGSQSAGHRGLVEIAAEISGMLARKFGYLLLRERRSTHRGRLTAFVSVAASLP